MFDKAYNFELIDKHTVAGNGDLIATYYYKFEGKRWYVVFVEEYAGKIFVVKFYADAYHTSADKYRILLDDYDAARVVRTSIDVMLSLYKDNPDASFGFIAASTKSGDYEESKYYNKRYRIYSQLMADYFSGGRFEHVVNELHSAYLLVNKCNKDVDTYTDNALKMFIRNYPNLDTDF